MLAEPSAESVPVEKVVDGHRLAPLENERDTGADHGEPQRHRRIGFRVWEDERHCGSGNRD